MEDDKSKEVGHTYLHMGNGGVSLSVLDGRYGPALLIETRHFGIRTNSMEIPTDPTSISKLAEMFQVAANHKYEVEPYIHAAKHWAPSSHNELQESKAKAEPAIQDDDGDVDL